MYDAPWARGIVGKQVSVEGMAQQTRNGHSAGAAEVAALAGVSRQTVFRMSRDGRLPGTHLVGRRGTEVAKRVDTSATALYAGLTIDQLSDLDLSYTPPLGSPWDAVQVAAQAWDAAARIAAVPA